MFREKDAVMSEFGGSLDYKVWNAKYGMKKVNRYKGQETERIR